MRWGRPSQSSRTKAGVFGEVAEVMSGLDDTGYPTSKLRGDRITA